MPKWSMYIRCPYINIIQKYSQSDKDRLYVVRIHESDVTLNRFWSFHISVSYKKYWVQRPTHFRLFVVPKGWNCVCAWPLPRWVEFCHSSPEYPQLPAIEMDVLVMITVMSVWLWKEYFPTLLESALLHQIFVFWVRDFKLWLLAYFSLLLTCAKFQQDWTTFILDIL